MNTPSLVWLIISSMSVCMTLSQTCPYTDLKCRCEGTTVTCKNLESIPLLQTGSDVIAVDALRFEDGNITSIPDNSLPPRLVNIYIVHNPVTNISDQAFRDSAISLKYLYLQNLAFTRVPGAFTNLTNLRNLTFNNIGIDNWNTAALENIVKSLSYLNFILIDLSTWPEWISRCRSLNQLHILYSRKTSIPETAFDMMSTSLVTLDIQFGDLIEVPEAFKSLTNLTTLDLSMNILKDDKGRPGVEKIMTFPMAKTLEKLTIFSTFIITLPNLSNSNSLKHIELFMNDIREVNSDLLPHSLVYLSLTYNNVNQITDTSFRHLSKLEMLYLDNNPLTDISSLAFKDLVSLRILDLSKTKLTQVPLGITALSSLQSLNLNYVSSLQCPDESLPELACWYCSRNHTLEVTGLYYNQESIASYLRGTCALQSVCSKDGGFILVFSGNCNFGCLLLLIAFFYLL